MRLFKFMRVFKFKDNIDGRFAFVVAKEKKEAQEELQKHTALPFHFVECRPVETVPSAPAGNEDGTPLVWKNAILPF